MAKGNIVLEYIHVSGLGFSKFGASFKHEGVKINLEHYTEATLSLSFRLPEPGVSVEVPDLEGITIEKDWSSTKKILRLTFHGRKVLEVISKMGQVADRSQIVELLAPFIAITTSMRAESKSTRDITQIPLDNLRIIGLELPFAKPRRTYLVGNVEVSVDKINRSLGLFAGIQTEIRLPRKTDLFTTAPFRSHPDLYISFNPPLLPLMGWTVQVHGPTIERFLEGDIRNATSLRQVWKMTKPFRDFLITNCRIEPR